ncbi:hypothetical protein CSA80_04630 [Candidatus Saccharibacteria bacterium]|nr:MAG: hypothetical protein CSA80_04630 [Candidatus Saccharibacteria bacterium]
MKPLLLTVGNVYLDNNIYGVESDEDKFKLEAGKEYAAAEAKRVPGGSAVNVAMQARRLGVDVAFVGKVGEDEAGKAVKALLEKVNIMSQLVGEDATLDTSIAVNLIGQDGQSISIYYGNASKQLSAEDIDINNGLLARGQAIYFGGTAKQTKLLAKGESLFREIHKKNVKIFYDPNRFPLQTEDSSRQTILGQLKYVEGYFPNEQELLQLSGETSVDKALDMVLSRGVRFVALKLGEQGCRVKTQQEDFAIDGLKVKPLSTVGAGDCFNATFIANYLMNKPLETCARLANAAAAIKVQQDVWPSATMIADMSKNSA